MHYFSFLIVTLLFVSTTHGKKYTPDWDSLDKRPLPDWYDDAKVGIFVHWGVFAVPAFGSEWFWWGWNQNNTDILEFMRKNYPPGWTYADFAHQFNAEFYDPYEWAEMIAASGAKYVVFSSKHHDGYCNWPSANSFNWNSMDIGPKRDLLGEFANAIRKSTSLKLGLYHSLFEWFNPLYIQDKNSGYKSKDFVRDKTMPELYDLVMKYKPELIWSDGDWDVSYDYWNSTSFLAWLYNESPVKDTVVVNDRWGAGAMCKHGDFYTCSDNYNPRKLLSHKWENCMPMDKKSWGYRRTMKLDDVLTMEEVIESVVESVSCGGNILINVGPSKEGRIVPIFEDRLRELGVWLKVNGEAIYGSKPWKYQNDTTNPNVWYTTKDENVYAILLRYPSGREEGEIKLTAPKATQDTQVTMLGYENDISWNVLDKGGIVIDVTTIMPTELPCKWAWTFKLTNV